MLRISNRLCGITLCLLVLTSALSAQTDLTAKAGRTSAPANAPVESDRTRDGLVGPVRRVRTEVAKLSNVSGTQQESKHVTLEIVSYDVKGNKIENQYFPIAGATLTGKEVYKYDDKGNISEMTMLNSDGTLLSKEIYKYEFDFAGNWNKMTTSVAVVDSRGITFEPTEVTYRAIMYYLDENMVKMVNPGAATITTPQPTAPAAAAPVNKPASSPSPANNTTAANNKPRDNKNIPNAPDVPSASTTATRLISGPVDLRTPGLTPSQEAF